MKKNIPGGNIEKYFNLYLACNTRSGKVRFLSWLAMIWFFITCSNILFSSQVIIDVAQKIQSSALFLSQLPLGLIAVPLTFLWPFSGLEFVILPIGALWIAILFTAQYVRSINRFTSYSEAVHYTFSCLFGLFLPTIIIREAAIDLDESGRSWLADGKGPGYVVVQPGSAILLERINSPSRVISIGRHYVTRFERIKQIIDLRDQHLPIDEEVTITKDRITVKIKKAYIRYRVASSSREEVQSKDNPASPFPYSVEAIRKLTYNRSVTEKGVTEWDTAVKFTAFGAITDYINENNYDRLFMPKGQHEDPRKEIIKRVNSPEVRNRLKNIGTKLAWFDIGYIGLSEENGDIQTIMPWQANWTGKTAITRASGEAQRLAYQELGRAEAQAEMLKSIVNMLNDIQVSENSTENIRNVVLARTAQLLESMTSMYEKNETG